MKIDINQALEQLATAFNTTADKLYPILIKQAIISGILDLIISIASLVILIVGIKLVIKHWEKIYDNDMESFVLVFGSISSLVLIVLSPVCFYTGVSALGNPEYWALKEILKAIGG